MAAMAFVTSQLPAGRLAAGELETLGMIEHLNCNLNSLSDSGMGIWRLE